MSGLKKGVEFMLKNFANANRFRVRKDQFAQMQTQLSCDRTTLLNTLIDVYQQDAFAEVSNFQVAAAAVGFSGDVYLGVNLETPLANLAHTVHAEQFAMVNAHKCKEAGLTQFVVTEFPCGHCRQFLLELPEADSINVSVPSKGLSAGLKDLLPHSFSVPGSPTLLSSRPTSNHLRLMAPRHTIFKELEDVALDAANLSFAPYSRCPAGVAVQLLDGKVFSGSYVESCAFNPSIGPMLSTVIDMISKGESKDRLKDISHAVIVEYPDVLVSQYGSLKEVLSKFAPQASISRLYARPESEEDKRRRYLQYKT